MRSPWPWWVVGVPLVVRTAAAAPGGPPAEPPPAEIELGWEAPAHCPQSEAIEQRIADLLTQPPRGEGTIQVTGVVTVVDDSYTLALSTNFSGRTDERTFEASSCETLGETASILLAVALEPSLQIEEEAQGFEVPAAPPIQKPRRVAKNTTTLSPAESVETAVSQAPAAAAKRDEPPAPETAPPKPRRPPKRRPRATPMIRAAMMLESGMLPGVSGGPRLAAGLVWSRFRIEMAGGYLLPRIRRADDVGVSYQAGFAMARACARLAAGPVVVPLCGGIEAGGIRAMTLERAGREVRTGPWLGPQVAAGVETQAQRVGLWAVAEVAARAYGSEFTRSRQQQFQQFVVSGRLVVGIQIFIP